MLKNQIATKSSQETKTLARKIVREYLKLNKSNNLVICLYGDLGGGKTTFTQGIAEELGITETVNSPTFLIMKKYNSLYHFDCYRISDCQEILDLGWEEIISGENKIIVIEWPEKIEKILPKERLDVKFEFVNENTRKISFKDC